MPVDQNHILMQHHKHLLSPGPIDMDRLANGLRIYSNTIPHVNSITAGIWINAGSREDPSSRPGLAHFLEHAVFKGTRSRDYIAIARCIEQVGGYIDAFTTKENTCIYIRCLKEHSELAFDLLSDLVCNPLLPEGEIEKEKEVIIEEIHGIQDSPDELIFDHFDELAFPDHPIGTSILGTEKSIDSISPKNLRSFLDRHYVAQNMLLTVIGNIAHEDVMLEAEKRFNSLDGQKKPSSSERTFKQAYYRPFLRRDIKQLYQEHLLFGGTAERNDRHFYSLLLLNTILSGGMSSILNLELREKNPLAYNVYSSLTCFDDTTMLNVYAGIDPEHTDRVLESIKNVLKPETFSSLSTDELLAAKNRLKGSMVMETEKMTNRMAKAARDIFYFGRPVDLKEKLRGIEAVRAEDIAAAAASLNLDTQASLLIYEPAEN